MKKLALLLGALTITATAFAGGKEIVPQGKEVEPVREIVKEVVVYRDRPVTRSAYPNGYVEMFYKWWGESTKDEHDGKAYDRRSNSNRGRLQLVTSINMTEKDNFYIRVRDNQAIGSYDTSTNKEALSGEGAQVRLRYSHNHDFLDGVATSRLHYQHETSGSNAEYTELATGNNNLEYQIRFNFARYGFDNDFVKTTNLTLAPKVGYSWDGRSNNDGDRSAYYGGIDLYTMHTLPWNFSFEFNLYTTYAKANMDVYKNANKALKDTAFQAQMEAYLYNETKLVDLGDSAKLSFYFEGGFDPYRYSNKRLYDQAAILGGSKTSSKKGDKTDYTLYALPALKLDYQINDNINTFLAAGATYQNVHTAGSEAQGFEWQPTAWAGFRKSF